MSFFDSKFYRVVDVLSFIVFINLLWVVSIFTIVLFLPCTFALFKASRAMIIDQDNRIIRPFVTTVKQYFIKANLIGLPFLLTGFSLSYYVFAFLSIEASWTVYLFTLSLTAVVLYLLFISHFLPIAAHVKSETKTTNLKRGFWFIFYKPLFSLLSLAVFVILTLVSVQFLIVGILASAGVIAYSTTYILLRKLDMLADEHPEAAETLHIQELI